MKNGYFYGVCHYCSVVHYDLLGSWDYYRFMIGMCAFSFKIKFHKIVLLKYCVI